MENENTIQKPITLVVEEFKEKLVGVINESHLPFFIIEGVVEKLLNDIKNASAQQLENDRVSYNKQLKEMTSQNLKETE